MRKIIVLTCSILFLLVGVALAAEPIAPPVPWNKDFLTANGKTAEEMNANTNIPDKDEVGVAAYPESCFYQSNTGIGDKILSVVLVSRDDPETVRAWYKKNYTGNAKINVKPFTPYDWQAKMIDIHDMKSEVWISIK